MPESVTDEPTMPLAFTLERAEAGYRIVMLGSDRAPIEAPTLDGVLDSLKHALRSGVTPSTAGSVEATREETASRACDEIARGFPTKAAFERIIERHPIPPAWHDEPDWTTGAE